jgi:hypothetical protein
MLYVLHVLRHHAYDADHSPRLRAQIDGKSDVYSFGLCIWELFSCQVSGVCVCTRCVCVCVCVIPEWHTFALVVCNCVFCR